MKSPEYFLIAIAAISSAFFDLRERRIPNWITYPLLLVALLFIDKTVIMFFALGLALLLFGGDLIGAGDIKLGLVVAVWSHHFHWSGYWLFISLLFAGVAAIMAYIRRDRSSLPFAPYIAAGFLISNLLI